ncbi:hypothetical protein C8Q74DRAFT_1051787 [Fomes fomentarius]|nr:hypothetical protein C8Q74DRAFT_1051787 [Fomes fomentarius]
MTRYVLEPFSAADILGRHQATLCSVTVEPGCVTCLEDDGESDIDEDSDDEDMDCTEGDGEDEMQVDYEGEEDDAEMRNNEESDEELPVFKRVTILEIPNLPEDVTGDEYRVMFPAIRHLDLGDRYHNWCGVFQRCREASKFTTMELDNKHRHKGVTDSWHHLQLVRGGYSTWPCSATRVRRARSRSLAPSRPTRTSSRT